MTAPVRNEATGLSSSAIQSATSSAVPIRPSGTCPASHRYASSRSSAQVAWMGVSIGPGRDAVDPDAGRRELPGEGLGQVVERGFGHAVHGLADQLQRA